MRIDELSVTNFKNFSNLNVQFSEGVNLFVGGNGSGKTSILEAINVAVGRFFNSQEQKMQRVIGFDEISIFNGKRESSASVKAISTLLQNQPWSRTIKRDTKTNSKSTNPAGEYGRNY